MTGTCRLCGKQIRRTPEGFWGTTNPNEGHPWYCPDDLGDDKRHEPAPEEEPVDNGQDYVVTVTNGSGRKELEIRASGQSAAWKYAALVCEHEGAGYYPAEIRPKNEPTAQRGGN
jgi:hypothetical protein